MSNKKYSHLSTRPTRQVLHVTVVRLSEDSVEIIITAKTDISKTSGIDTALFSAQSLNVNYETTFNF